MASSSIVIKVKFGKTLRRINASINDNKLALDMVMLKEKIRNLFTFGPGVEFTMTYVDEDGDAVTLADDDDLLDVVRQSLNPLRITVKINGPSGVSEILKSVPDPLLEALSKLLPPEASSSAPAVAELVEKFKALYLNQVLPSVASSRVHCATESSTVKDSKPEAGGLKKKEKKVQVNPEAAGASKKKEKEVQKVAEGVKFKDVQPPTGVNFNTPFNYGPFPASVGITKSIGEGPPIGVKYNAPCYVNVPFPGSISCKTSVGEGPPTGVNVNTPYSYYSPFQASISAAKSVGEGSTGKNKNATDGVEIKKDSSPWKDGITSEPLKPIEQLNQKRQAHFAKVAADAKKSSIDSGSYSGWAHQGMWNATNTCPFSGMPLTNNSDSQGKRQSLDNNGMGSVFHQGVICDGCEAHPITGPRFKSKVKLDYDLCSACFAKMGNATDYIRLDQPINRFKHPLMPFKGLHDPFLRSQPHAMQASGPKLDCQFILDVNVVDGTIMAPLTAFTKIWRMRNNGSIIWPYGSQLKWIGGDQLSKLRSVGAKIPVNGLPVDKELDIAVDFTAPKLPGRYVSYWRMSSPSGQMFGQRVWVLIQVDASVKNLGGALINLNLPPVTRDQETVNQDHPVDNIISGNTIITGSENKSVDLPPKDHDLNFPISDSLIIYNNGASNSMPTLSAPPVVTASSSVFNSTEVGTALGSLPAGPTVTEPIGYPTVDLSLTTPIVNSGSSSPAKVVVQPSGSDDQEQALVKDLEEMGFKQLDLNKEVLRKNNYDLEKSIDDLCGVLEWDPMLDELHEMGFEDDEVNMRLLKKNNGSIKGVVMDLISEESA